MRDINDPRCASLRLSDYDRDRGQLHLILGCQSVAKSVVHYIGHDYQCDVQDHVDRMQEAYTSAVDPLATKSERSEARLAHGSERRDAVTCIDTQRAAWERIIDVAREALEALRLVETQVFDAQIPPEAQ